MQFVKKIAALVAALCLVLTVSAASAEVLEVKIWDNVQLEGLQTIADLWTEQSGIDVNIQVVTWDEYWTLLEAGATGGSLPDVFWMHSNSAQMYMENDMLLDLTDYIAKSDAVKMENYYPGISELYSFNGKQYAMAKDHDTIALIYNKAIFDKCGVEYPNDSGPGTTTMPPPRPSPRQARASSMARP